MADVPEVAPVDQIKRFVDFARVARGRADFARGETRNLLLNMAEQWEKLAACSADLTRQALEASALDAR
jgi:hypothetical protein